MDQISLYCQKHILRINIQTVFSVFRIKVKIKDLIIHPQLQNLLLLLAVSINYMQKRSVKLFYI